MTIDTPAIFLYTVHDFKNMFAVIRTGGKQYRVSEHRKLRIEKLPEAARKNGKITFSDVLLTADGSGRVTVGKPLVSGARVEAGIVSDGRAAKVRVVKYKPKTRFKRVRGHRQPFTEVKIEKILLP